MTATVQNAARVAAGFDITATGGTISTPISSNTTLNGTTGIHHTAPKNFVGGSASWTFTWTAPPASSPLTSVTFNFAGNAVNQSGTDQGDVPNRLTFPFTKAISTPPTPTVTASGPTIVCSGQTLPTLTAVSPGATSFQWFNGATQITGVTTATYSPSAAGSYTAKGVNTAGTSAASTAVTITVNPAPVLTATQSDATPCPGQCDTITINSSVANTSYTFTAAGSPSSPVIGNTIVFCVPGPPNNPTTPLVLTITGTAASTNCQGTTSQTITPNLPPPAVFTHTNTGLTYSFTGPTGASLNYDWNFGNGQTSTLANPSVTYATGGTYTVTLLVTNSQTGCIATTSQSVQATTSVAALVGLEGFRFGPNPTRRELTLYTGTLKADIRLLDLSGKAVATLRTRDEVSTEKTVSLAHLSAGLYFLEVTTQNARKVEKLIMR